jgi:hypothetical protein
MADRLGVESIDREGRTVVLKFRPQAKIDPARLVALVRQRSDLALVPPAAIRLTLDGVGGLGLGAGRTTARTSSQPLASSPRKSGGRYSGASPSWWTTRARAGEVKPGFTKEEILRPAKENPRAPGGIFESVGALLSDLLHRM